MQRNRFIRLISGLILVVFLAGVMPKEYLHSLVFDHQDDVHPVYKKGELVITPEHNHCSFLGFVLAPFVSTEKQFLSFPPQLILFTQYLLPGYHCSYSAPVSVRALRGPPVLVV